MFFHISQSLKDKQRVASQTFSSTFSLGQTAAALRLSHTLHRHQSLHTLLKTHGKIPFV